MINDRRLEKTKLNGFLIYIKYNGLEFEGFDENKNFKTVKGTIKKILYDEEIKLYKGIQQAGRTDKNVSANENILYIQTDKNNIEKLLKYEIITKIEKVIPFLELPEYISKRKYIFSYPVENIKNTKEKIIQLCNSLSGLKDFKRFTTKKGKLLKNTIREININYIDNKLIFEGNSFMPQQVRIMSAYILTNTFKPLDGKYLVLDKVTISDNLKDFIFHKIDFNYKDVEYCESSNKYTLIYTKDYSKLIGKNGKNIKKLGIDNKVIVRKV